MFDESFGYLFNSYYQAVGPQHPQPNRGLISRPSVAEVGDYRRHVDDAMVALLDDLTGGGGGGRETLVELGLHHEQQHQELLLMDIKHVLAQNPRLPAYRGEGSAGAVSAASTSTSAAAPTSAAVPTSAPTLAPTSAGGGSLRWHSFGGGLTEIGFGSAAGGGASGGGRSAFCFDNETPAHELLVPAFELAGAAVTCGQWLEFMEDGGYGTCELWLSDGWAARQAEGWEAPLYWLGGAGGADGAGGAGGVNGSGGGGGADGWQEFTLDGLRPVDLDAPVCHVSYYEADAFARWAGARLPTEAEWECAARSVLELGAGSPGGNFLDSGRLAPAAAGSESADGPLQMFGDVWEWTASPYVAYPGFRPNPGAVGEYNGKFMVNQYVLRGGCCVTPAGHIRSTYRNFFYPQMRWLFSGLRLARDGG